MKPSRLAGWTGAAALLLSAAAVTAQTSAGGTTPPTQQTAGSSRSAGGATRAAATAAVVTHAAISEADLRHRLFLIADDSMGGRPTGSRGHVMVTEYIAAEMKRLGLEPAGDDGTYFQNVPFVRRTVAAGSSLEVGGRPLERNVDYIPFDAQGPTRSFMEGAQVIYGGIINDTTTHITAEQAAGKVVVLRSPFSGIIIGRGLPGSRWADAAALIVVVPDAAQRFFPQIASGGPVRTKPAPAFTQPQPLIVIESVAARLFSAPWDANLQPGTTGATMRGRIAFHGEPVIARNVVAVLPGRSPALRGQYVAIGAHSDHDPVRPVGVDHDSLRTFNAIARRMTVSKGSRLTGAERAAIVVNMDSLRRIAPARRDSILNGADDDGSGTVALMEIAEAMAHSATKPHRSTLFIWHVAEELGLLGAEYYTDNPTVPRDSIVAALNVDMIGRGGVGEEIGGGPDYLQLIGWRRLSNELGDLVDAANAKQPLPFRFDLSYDAEGHPEQYYCRSDHYMYARYAIPVVFFTTGSHGDYHQVTDEPQYIGYTKLRAVTNLIHDVAKQVGDLPHRVAVDGPRPDPTGQCRQ
ncbi:hypothetical protein BH23GEM9_BH23GEM9_16980 [soil metagenome]